VKPQPERPSDYLRRLGETSEGPLDLVVAALKLSALDHSNQDLEPYHGHLQEVAEQARIESSLVMSAEGGARAIVELLAGRFGYDGDRLAYDDPQNADLISVIDRRQGLPVALGILYIHAARAAGSSASGLNSPGHFLLRIELRGSETFVDPFNGGAALEREKFGSPPSTRNVSVEDMQARQPVADVEVLLRLQNNVKLRAVQLGETARAAEIARRMVLVAPQRPELWMDLAHLNEEQGALGAARKAYDACMALTKSGTSLHKEAALGLQGLKHRLN
jgi:regulator of sirC expression with transglutaminase-like and TPR domain